MDNTHMLHSQPRRLNQRVASKLPRKVWFAELSQSPFFYWIYRPVYAGSLLTKQALMCFQEVYTTLLSFYNRTVLGWNYS